MEKQNNRVSVYKGVGWHREQQKWRSSVSQSGVKYDCGYHDSEREAAKARDRKILALGLSKSLQILKPVE
ncbi:hypothetical protein CFS9_03160 [Flavobacterium sp. CFS9]|uniref:AP2 domain-containing protein n=1 Tax=Flavobacterium sp. CFS9 TaxID=3143118 RepID=A0AAT9GWT1_9FLAO